MAIIDFPGPAPTATPAPTHSERPRPLAAAFGSLGALWTAWKNRRVAMHLAGLDDRMLADIGVTRGDVEAALSGAVREDPTQRLAGLAAERRRAVRPQRLPGSRRMEI
jgi:uncharacterized protein YjiS (DUF1127 family)